MVKCLKCEKKIKNSFFSKIPFKEIKMGSINCPHCKERNFLDKSSLKDINVIYYTPLVVALLLLLFASTISLLGYLLAIFITFAIGNSLKGWFVRLSDKSRLHMKGQKD